jgi:hypothetical protein
MSPKQLQLNLEDKSAPIERLPGEILSEILIYSLEWNLVRASDIIDRKAPGPLVYHIFVFHAFWAYPQDWLRPERQPTLPYWYQPLSAREQQRLQISIQRTEWFTVERLIGMIPIFQHATHCFAASKTIIVPFPTQRLDLVEPLPAVGDDVDDTLHRTAKILVYDIPKAALFGPWDDDKLGLLVFLHRNLYYAAMIPGFRRPMLPRNLYLRAIRSALAEDQYWAFFYILLMLKTSDVCRSVGTEPVLPGSLFRSALQQSHDGKYLFLLLQVCPRSLPVDACFYNWAVAQKADDRVRAKVLETLEENSNRRLGILALQVGKLVISTIRGWNDARHYQKIVTNL